MTFMEKQKWLRTSISLVATATGSLSAILGLMIILGWHSHNVTLIQVHPSFVPMQYNTALGFLLCGLGLLALTFNQPRLAGVNGTLAASIGSLTLLEYLAGFNLGIDELLMVQEIMVEVSHPGRMAPNTALCFLLAGSALFLMSRSILSGKWLLATGVLGALVVLLGSTALLGYAIGAETAYGWANYTRMAVHTAAGFVVLGFGILALTWSPGISFRDTEQLPVHQAPGESRRIILASILIMCAASLVVGIVVLRELYLTALEEERSNLVATLDSWSELAEAVTRYGESHHEEAHTHGPVAVETVTLVQIEDALGQLGGFRETGEFTLARRQGGQMIFLLHPRHTPAEALPLQMPAVSDRAEPMRRALQGQSGTLIGRDYRGETVLAAYRPLKGLKLGLVAKIDLAEVRRPFIRATLLAGGIALVVIALSAVAIHVKVSPMIRRLEESFGLEQKVQRLGRIMDQSWNEIYLFTTDNLRFTRVNQGAQRNLGYDQNELLSLGLLDINSEITRDAFDTLTAPLRAGKTDRVLFETYHRRRDGTGYPVEASLQLFRGESPPLFVAVMQDITQRNQAEEQLRKLSRAVEQSPVAVVITSPEGHIEYVNPRFTAITGYQSDEVVGKTPRILQSGETALAVYEELWRTITSGKEWRGEIRNRRQNGEEYWASESISPIRDRAGTITHFVMVQEDITTHKHSEQALFQLNRSLTTLSACNEALVHAEDEATLLTRICHQIISNSGHRMACVAYLGDQALQPIACADPEQEFLEHIRATCADSTSPSAVAVRTGETQLIHDFQADPTGEPWHDDALTLGFTAICALPLMDNGTPFGVLSIYATRPGAFGREELPLFQEVAEDLAYGIMTMRARVEREELRRQNEYILNAAGEGLYGMDRDGRATFVNPAAASMLGWEAEELLGRYIHDLIHHSHEDGSPFLRHQCPTHAVLLDGHPRHVEKDLIYRKDGSRFYVEYTSTPISEGGETIGAVVVFRDISERMEAEAELKESRQRFELAVQGTSDGLWDWNPITNEVWFARRFKELLGYEEHELPSTFETWETHLHPDDHDHILSEIQLHLDHCKPFDVEGQLRTRNNGYRWFRTRGQAVRDETGKAVRMAGSIQDITERKQIEAQLIHSALHDSLTGLPNRALLMDRLEHAIELGKRQTEKLAAVLYLDLDRFKVINDSLGHLMGDQLLIQIARRLQQCLRSGDTVARLGGDEFVMVLGQNYDQDTVFQIAERLQQVVAKPLRLDGHEIFTTTSIGIAFSSGAYRRAEELLRDADTAMYYAKGRGGDCTEVFEPEMRDGAVKRFSLEHQLRQALEEEQLSLHYQPIVALASGRVAGFEALARWHHPEKGFISPMEFIPVAEETGLILPMGSWILEQACRFIQDCTCRFPHAADVYVSVNLSPRQISQANLLEELTRILDETGLKTANLRLEITENILMENSGAANELLPRLKQLGIQLYMDDFGTGYSSLSYLHSFPIDVLKIDRSFITKMELSNRHMQLVTTIISLARNFDMRIIAEGVETAAQAETLNRLGCHYGQGYRYARPLTEEQVRQLLQLEPCTLPQASKS